MISKSLEVSKRYAQALNSILLQQKNRKNLIDQLNFLDRALDVKNIKEFLISPMWNKKQKTDLIQHLIESANLDPLISNFIQILVKKNRIIYLGNIIQALEEIEDKESLVLRGRVRSSFTLKEAEKNSIEEKLNLFFNKKVILSYEIDSQVIGGLVAEVGSYRFDDTLSTHLKKLKEELKRSAQ